VASKFRLTPRENANVTQSELVSNQVRRLAGGDVVDLALRRETVVEHLVQALGLGLVAVDGVGDLLGGVCGKGQPYFQNQIPTAHASLQYSQRLKWLACPCIGPMPLCCI
jgi:hypothetical protein